MLTEEQINKRKNRLGGSDIPAVLGVSPYKTKRQLALEKLGLSEPSPMTNAMRRGNILEPVVAKMFRDETGIKFSKPTKTYEHPKYSWLVGHFDGLTTKHDLIEIKTMNLSKYLKTKREGLPVEITSQVQAYLSWPKMRKAYVVCFSAEVFEYFVVDQEPDQEFQEIIFREGSEFIANLQSGILPPEEQQPVIDLPKADTGEVLKLDTPDFIEAVNELREAQQILKEAKEYEEQVKQTIIDRMGNYPVIEADGLFRAYYREQGGRRSFDGKAFARAHPDIDLSKFYKVGLPFKTFKAFFLDRRES